jgi:hypothetical protein
VNEDKLMIFVTWGLFRSLFSPMASAIWPIFNCSLATGFAVETYFEVAQAGTSDVSFAPICPIYLDK